MEPYIGQIMAVAFSFAPRGWALCQGQLLNISDNQSLYALIGTHFGGDGRTTFALPDLRGRVAVGIGTGVGLSPVDMGGRGGAEYVTLTLDQIPAHNHTVAVKNEHGTVALPANQYLAGTFKPGRGTEAIESNSYADTQDSTLNAQTISNTGGSQGHINMQPYLGINYIIALEGIFPSRS
jgi:microcystin-dependent protein